MLKPGVDGHVYEAVPQDRRAIEDARLILYSGYNFEPNLAKLSSPLPIWLPKLPWQKHL
ncbi:metal ABC transporter solute-binding protein, Zn/Mn family [Leptodesmis sp.]|uniref:metal ABC transporter solute-binding protein, Zn/Mn family n=1 Tax=Leptodesmis sp. TaxID=3100501 RepID=UPI0040535299